MWKYGLTDIEGVTAQLSLSMFGNLFPASENPPRASHEPSIASSSISSLSEQESAEHAANSAMMQDSLLDRKDKGLPSGHRDAESDGTETEQDMEAMIRNMIMNMSEDSPEKSLHS